MLVALGARNTLQLEGIVIHGRLGLRRRGFRLFDATLSCRD
jgi:hypothetical protein